MTSSSRISCRNSGSGARDLADVDVHPEQRHGGAELVLEDVGVDVGPRLCSAREKAITAMSAPSRASRLRNAPQPSSMSSVCAPSASTRLYFFIPTPRPPACRPRGPRHARARPPERGPPSAGHGRTAYAVRPGPSAGELPLARGTAPAHRTRWPPLPDVAEVLRCVFVVLYHLVRQVGQVTDLSMLAWFGRSGVTFFVVLSGLVLAWTYADAMPRLRVFWWRRFARIWPLHVVATLLSVGVYVLLTARSRPRASSRHSGWCTRGSTTRRSSTWQWRDLVAQRRGVLLPLLPAAAGGDGPGRDARGWPCWSWSRDGRAGRGVGPRRGERGHPHDAGWALDYFPPTRLLQFAVGCLGLALARGWRPRVQLRSAVLALVAYALCCSCGARPSRDLALGALLGLAALRGAGVPARGARCRLPRHGGRDRLAGLPVADPPRHWSFAWYLVHEIVIRSLLALGGRPQGLAETAGVWLVALVVSQALAGLLYTLVEHPTERRLRALVGDGRPVQAEVTEPTDTPEHSLPGQRPAARPPRSQATVKTTLPNTSPSTMRANPSRASVERQHGVDDRLDAVLPTNRASRCELVTGAHGRADDAQLAEEDLRQLGLRRRVAGRGAADDDRAARAQRLTECDQVAAPTVSITASTRSGSRAPDSNARSAPISTARAPLASSRR